MERSRGKNDGDLTFEELANAIAWFIEHVPDWDPLNTEDLSDKDARKEMP